MKKCKHNFLQIEEHHALGYTVSCMIEGCEITFDLDDEVVQREYIPFIYHYPGTDKDDIEILIHPLRVSGI